MKKNHYCSDCKEPQSYCTCEPEFKCRVCYEVYHSEEDIRESDGVCWKCIDEQDEPSHEERTA